MVRKWRRAHVVGVDLTSKLSFGCQVHRLPLATTTCPNNNSRSGVAQPPTDGIAVRQHVLQQRARTGRLHLHGIASHGVPHGVLLLHADVHELVWSEGGSCETKDHGAVKVRGGRSQACAPPSFAQLGCSGAVDIWHGLVLAADSNALAHRREPPRRTVAHAFQRVCSTRRLLTQSWCEGRSVEELHTPKHSRSGLGIEQQCEVCV